MTIFDLAPLSFWRKQYRNYWSMFKNNTDNPLRCYIENEVLKLRIAELEAELSTRNARILPPVIRPDFHIDLDE